MAKESPFQELISRLQGGDQAAAAEVFQRFAQRLIALARSRLDPLVRGKLDPEDVIQSVFRSFFTRQADGEYDLRSWGSLWSLLTVITLRKCGYRVRHYHAERRDVHREIALGKGSDSAPGWQAVAREPAPEEAAVLTETVEQLMRSLGERDRRILELTLQGETVAQIGIQVQCSQRTVERILERTRRRLEAMGDQERTEA